jgi:hypothetical protein
VTVFRGVTRRRFSGIKRLHEPEMRWPKTNLGIMYIRGIGREKKASGGVPVAGNHDSGGTCGLAPRPGPQPRPGAIRAVLVCGEIRQVFAHQGVDRRVVFGSVAPNGRSHAFVDCEGEVLPVKALPSACSPARSPRSAPPATLETDTARWHPALAPRPW